MKAKKIKIKINDPDESPGEAFKREAIEDFHRVQKGSKTIDSDYDIVLTFPNTFWLNKIFSPERLRLFKMIKKENPQSVYQLAKLLNRAVANVQRDVTELNELGIIELKKTRKKGQKKETVCPQCNWDGFDIAV